MTQQQRPREPSNTPAERPQTKKSQDQRKTPNRTKQPGNQNKNKKNANKTQKGAAGSQEAGDQNCFNVVSYSSCLEVVSSLVVSLLFPHLVVQTMMVSLLCSRLFEMGACFPLRREVRDVATQSTLGGNDVATQCGGNDVETQTDFWLELEQPPPPPALLPRRRRYQ